MVAIPKALRSTPAKVALAAAAVGGIAAYALRDETRTKKKKASCEGVGQKGGTLDGVRYLEHVTKGADPNQSLPMLIVFHSLGANPKGTAGFKSLPPTRVIRPFGPYKRGGGYSWFKKTPRGDLEALAEDMKVTADEVIPFVANIQKCRPTMGRPVVTGSSQGGHMAYLLASLIPHTVGGAVAVAGYIPPQLWNENMARTVGIHGTKDNTVPFERTKTFAETLGFPFYAFDAGHNIPKPMGKKWVEEVSKMRQGAMA